MALIHDRPVLGGNASSEIRVHTLGIYGHFRRILEKLDTEHYPNGSPEAFADEEKRQVLGVRLLDGPEAVLSHVLDGGAAQSAGLAAGDNIVALSTLYGGTYALFAHTLPQFGVEVRFVDPDHPEALAEVVDDRTNQSVFAISDRIETTNQPGRVVALRIGTRRQGRNGQFQYAGQVFDIPRGRFLAPEFEVLDLGTP